MAGSDTKRTIMLLVNGGANVVGDGRALRMKAAESIATDLQLLVCKMQKGFRPSVYAMADTSVAESHNIASWRYGEGLPPLSAEVTHLRWQQ
jgi:hypothetical protein